MLTFYQGTASVDQMVDLSIAVQIIIAVVFGGRRTILGGVLGSIFLVLFDELLRPIGQLNTFVVSGVALIVILFWPDGVLGYVLRPREQR
jgi:branched-chain amino acid transport system permease protein